MPAIGRQDCTVLEIGPGIGTLTRSLAARYRQVIALEIDRSLIPVLRYTLEDCPNVTVVNEDVMQTDLAGAAGRGVSRRGRLRSAPICPITSQPRF